MEVLFALAVIIGIPWLIYGFAMFDRLVRWQHEHQHAAWEADGRPDGFFWRTPECSFWRSSSARQRLAFEWLFSTPDWVRGSEYCSSALRRLRVIVLVWNASILTIVLWSAF